MLLTPPDSPIPPWSSHILHCLHKDSPTDPKSPGHLCPPALWLMPAESLSLWAFLHRIHARKERDKTPGPWPCSTPLRYPQHSDPDTAGGHSASMGDFGVRLWGKGTGTWHVLMSLSWLALGSTWRCRRSSSKDGLAGRAARRRAGALWLAPHSLARQAAHPRSRPTPLALSLARRGHRLSWDRRVS